MIQITIDDVFALYTSHAQLDYMNICLIEERIFVSMRLNTEYMRFVFDYDESIYKILPRSNLLILRRVTLPEDKKWYLRYTNIIINNCKGLNSELLEYIIDTNRLTQFNHNGNLNINLKHVSWFYRDYLPSCNTIINKLIFDYQSRCGFDMFHTFLTDLVQYTSINQLEELYILMNVQKLLKSEQKTIYNLLKKVNTKHIRIRSHVNPTRDIVKGDLLKIQKMANLGNVVSLKLNVYLNDKNTVLDQDNLVITKILQKNLKMYMSWSSVIVCINGKPGLRNKRH